jgi:hypothetical protein
VQTSDGMKKIMWSFVMVSYLLLSCEEPEEQKLVVKIGNSPTCVYQSYENPGSGWVHRFYFFDLNHEETKDKKYFVAEFLSGTSDSMRIVKEPRSIDSLGRDFPAEIMEYPGLYGIGFWVNADYIVRYTPDRTAFYKDFAPKNPNEIYYFLNNRSIVGNLEGEWPNAEAVINVPDGTGPYRKVQAFFYFKHGLCLVRQQQFGSEFDDIGVPLDEGRLTLYSIDQIFPMTSSYEWETVVSAFQRNGSFPSFLFFDFKKWRYFTWKEGRTGVIGNTTYRTIEYGDYKDLDKMLKWPEGWGKP